MRRKVSITIAVLSLISSARGDTATPDAVSNFSNEAGNASESEERPCCTPADDCWPTQDQIQDLENALDPDAERTLWWEGDGSPRVSAVPYASEGDQPLFGAGKSLKAIYVAGDDQSAMCFEDPAFLECLRNIGTTEYSYNSGKDSSACPFDDSASDQDTFCRVAVRNYPRYNWIPGITAFPLNAEHVQTLVKFAEKHNMCVSVAGTGHDFNNRHSSGNHSMFIRTPLMKGIEFGENDETMIVGPGHTFSELHYEASKKGRYVASGWANTVGVTGWSLGGGHGPFGSKVGLGSDNVVSMDIVIGDGRHVRANSSGTFPLDGEDLPESLANLDTQDLIFALRGGGGSTWGVVTSLEIKAHENPPGGFTVVTAETGNLLCGAGLDYANKYLDKYLAWVENLGQNWSGYLVLSSEKPSDYDSLISSIFAPALGLDNTTVTSCGEFFQYFDLPKGELDPDLIAKSPKCDETCQTGLKSTMDIDGELTPEDFAEALCPVTCGTDCPAAFAFTLEYVYLGSPDDQEFKDTWDTFTEDFRRTIANVDHYDTWWDYVKVRGFHPISPTNTGGYGYLQTGVPSVLVPRSALEGPDGDTAASEFGNLLRTLLFQCAETNATECWSQQIFQDVGGNLGDKNVHLPASETSISPGFQDAMFHFVATPSLFDENGEPRSAEDEIEEIMQNGPYTLGPNSYFSESAFQMEGDSWRDRYWGSENAERISKVKKAVDPNSRFWCHHCMDNSEAQ